MRILYSMKKDCLIVINKLSGNAEALDIDSVKAKLSSAYSKFEVKYIPEDLESLSMADYGGVAVCGGDGTLNHIINTRLPEKTSLYYVPCGTLNEVYNAQKESTLNLVGHAGDILFSYVCATGTFTPLGYAVGTKTKKKFKALAYVSKVIREYRVHDIWARMMVDGKTFDGEYTLIMLINSPRCFGFNFNKLYHKGEMCLLTIKSPGKDNLLNRARIFFPFFRAFFIGFRKPYESKNLLFTPFKHVDLELLSPTPFCVDGEKYEIEKTIGINITKLRNPINILSN